MSLHDVLEFLAKQSGRTRRPSHNRGSPVLRRVYKSLPGGTRDLQVAPRRPTGRPLEAPKVCKLPPEFRKLSPGRPGARQVTPPVAPRRPKSPPGGLQIAPRRPRRSTSFAPEVYKSFPEAPDVKKSRPSGASTSLRPFALNGLGGTREA